MMILFLEIWWNLCRSDRSDDFLHFRFEAWEISALTLFSGSSSPEEDFDPQVERRFGHRPWLSGWAQLQPVFGSRFSHCRNGLGQGQVSFASHAGFHFSGPATWLQLWHLEKISGKFTSDYHHFYKMDQYGLALASGKPCFWASSQRASTLYWICRWYLQIF